MTTSPTTITLARPVEAIPPPVLSASSRPHGSLVAKAVLDRTAAAVLLLLLAVPIALLCVAIRLDSSGPAVFRQTRVGLRGRRFTIYKLRSMTVGAEGRLDELRHHNESAGPLFKMRRDPRVTRVGRFIRTTSLDELPQLWNVLRGEMSLVGPRPALPEEVATYSDRERRRLAVKPGITGLWQVSGRSRLSWETTVDLDLSYVDSWSVRTDLVLLARTVRAVVTRDGAH
jgi:lipopolysaccharide/colanic/teichoic acid biosynthesis glycosyltransferase